MSSSETASNNHNIKDIHHNDMTPSAKTASLDVEREPYSGGGSRQLSIKKTTMTATENSSDVVLHRSPVLLRDARFRAGRTLIQSGRAAEGATEMFATLLEEARSKYGEANIETAVAYYEYGNALFRALLATAEDNSRASTVAAASPAKRRSNSNTSSDNTSKLDTLAESAANSDDTIQLMDQGDLEMKTMTVQLPNELKRQQEDSGDIKEEDDDYEDDAQLALEMMETAWSILDDFVTTMAAAERVNLPTSEPDYSDWAMDEIPRVLVGISDVLSHVDRHADAADALSRALPYREQALNKILEEHGRMQNSIKALRAVNGLSSELISIEHLMRRRQLAEVNILVAEELLACPADEDVLTTESKDLLVTAAERVDFAGGYYDRAREELQETVYLLGKLAARVGTSTKGEVFEKAKEDVCFLATLIMGVGEQLAANEEAEELNEAASTSSEQLPVKKQKQSSE